LSDFSSDLIGVSHTEDDEDKLLQSKAFEEQLFFLVELIFHVIISLIPMPSTLDYFLVEN
ncbi:Uncharacterized protein DAT39_021015, partial [Clarias magur]